MPNFTVKLNPTEQKALKEFKDKLVNKFGSDLVMIKLFGSKARGDSRQESDIDVLVIVKNLTKNNKHWIIDLAYELSLKYKLAVSPRIYSEQIWKYYLSLPLSFTYTVEKEGIKL